MFLLFSLVLPTVCEASRAYAAGDQRALYNTCEKEHKYQAKLLWFDFVLVEVDVPLPGTTWTLDTIRTRNDRRSNLSRK